MNPTPWQVQALAAGVVAAGTQAVLIVEFSWLNAFKMAAAFLVGAATYIVGKFQEPPKGQEKS